ncbi:MAG: hypothetical protein SFW35_01435 [Chitinophagales bacterium]|nr:hypothetical protein [Chitinophagales bacterium]
MEFSHIEKQGIIANLVKLAQVDRQMLPNEVIYIQSIALKLSIPPADFQDILSRVDYLVSSLPSSPEVKQRMFYIVCNGMNIDGQSAQEELEFCKRLGANLYLQNEKVAQVLEMLRQPNQDVMTEAVFIAALN